MPELIINFLVFSLPSAVFNSENLEVSRWGTIKINLKTMQTNLTGVFAAGDIVRGSSLVVWGIKDGRDVAERIHTYLEEKYSTFIKSSEKEAAHAI